MRDIKNIFINETFDNLTIVEEQLTRPLGEFLSDEVLDVIIRTMHNIKGVAPMVGFNHMTKIATPVEKTFKMVKDNNGIADIILLSKTKDAVDVIKKLLFNDDAHTPQTKEEQEVLIHFFENITA